jgi:hypothetical protein
VPGGGPSSSLLPDVLDSPTSSSPPVSVSPIVVSGGPVTVPLEKRAPYDLSCPAPQLTYKKLGSGTVGVDGCGNRATYKYVTGGVGWVMDSASQPVAAPEGGPQRRALESPPDVLADASFASGCGSFTVMGSASDRTACSALTVDDDCGRRWPFTYFPRSRPTDLSPSVTKSRARASEGRICHAW